jgi:general secretion pathway protein G
MTLDYQPLPKKPPLKISGDFIVIIFLLLVISPLVYFVLSPFPAHTQPGKMDAATATLNLLANSLELFHADNARYPTTAEGLSALTTNPGLPTWHGPYSTRTIIPTDPWGTPYTYASPGPPGKPYQLSSNGPDLLPATPDDITAP